MINECYDKCMNDALEGGKSHSHMPADTHNTNSSSRPSLQSKLHILLRDAQACGVCVCVCLCVYVCVITVLATE
jgi:hypothetical protein